MKTALAQVMVLARREVVTRGRSPAFRISSAVLLLTVIAVIVVPTIIAGRSGPARVAVVAGPNAAAVSAATRSAADALDVKVTVTTLADRASAERAVRDGEQQVAVVGLDELIWRQTESSSLNRVLTTALTQVALAQRADRLGLDTTQLAELVAPVQPTVTRLEPDRQNTPEAAVAMIGLVLLFMAINFYGSYVLMGVVEEKSNRVVEVLLGRTTPARLLAGKVLGIGLLGLAQLCLLAAVALVGVRVTDLAGVPAGTTGAVLGVVMWFVLGYAFYSVLYGALGALASRPEDAQAAVGPLTVVLLVAYFGAFASLSMPEAWWVTLGSLLPPTAPMFMPLRTAMVAVPLWQLLLSVLLMLAGVLALVAVGGRLYRGGVLRTGGRVKLSEAWSAGAAD